MTESVKDRNTELVSKRWAKALIDLAQEDVSVSKQDILNDLREVASVIDSSEELSNVISNPSISTEEKQIVLCKLFENNIMPIVNLIAIFMAPISKWILILHIFRIITFNDA